MKFFRKKIGLCGICIAGCLLFFCCGTTSHLKDAGEVPQQESAREPKALGIQLVQEHMGTVG